jgi:rRNA maturation protein Rpf1
MSRNPYVGTTSKPSSRRWRELLERIGAVMGKSLFPERAEASEDAVTYE